MRNLIHSIFYCPAIEVVGLLIVVVEHLRKHFLVVGIAEGVFNADQIRLGRILPTILELLRHATTTLREAGIANLVAITKYLSACGFQGLFNSLAGLSGNALIALTVVVLHGIRLYTIATIARGMVDIRHIVIQHHQDVVQPMIADVPLDVAITTELRRLTITVRLARPHAPTARRLPLAAVAVAQAVDPLAEVAAVDARLLADAHSADEDKWIVICV